MLLPRLFHLFGTSGRGSNDAEIVQKINRWTRWKNPFPGLVKNILLFTHWCFLAEPSLVKLSYLESFSQISTRQNYYNLLSFPNDCILGILGALHQSLPPSQNLLAGLMLTPGAGGVWDKGQEGISRLEIPKWEIFPHFLAIPVSAVGQE